MRWATAAYRRTKMANAARSPARVLATTSASDGSWLIVTSGSAPRACPCSTDSPTPRAGGSVPSGAGQSGGRLVRWRHGYAAGPPRVGGGPADSRCPAGRLVHVGAGRRIRPGGGGTRFDGDHGGRAGGNSAERCTALPDGGPVEPGHRQRRTAATTGPAGTRTSSSRPRRPSPSSTRPACRPMSINRWTTRRRAGSASSGSTAAASPRAPAAAGRSWPGERRWPGAASSSRRSTTGSAPRAATASTRPAPPSGGRWWRTRSPTARRPSTGYGVRRARTCASIPPGRRSAGTSAGAMTALGVGLSRPAGERPCGIVSIAGDMDPDWDVPDPPAALLVHGTIDILVPYRNAVAARAPADRLGRGRHPGHGRGRGPRARRRAARRRGGGDGRLACGARRGRLPLIGQAAPPHPRW